MRAHAGGPGRVATLGTRGAHALTIAAGLLCRSCRVKGLCYLHEQQEFILFHGPRTTLHGLPENRFLPALASVGGVADHNLLHFTYTDVPAGALSALAGGAAANVTWVQGTSVLLYRFKPDNVMHVMHDDVIPLYHTLAVHQQQLHPRAAPVGIITVDPWPSPSSGAASASTNVSDVLLSLLAHGGPVVAARELAPTGLVCFQDAIVGITKGTRWYQYGFHTPQGPLPAPGTAVDTRGASVRGLTRHIADHLLGGGHGVTGHGPLGCVRGRDDAPTCAPRGIVVFSRTQNRLVLNEDDLVAGLGQAFGGRSVTVLRMETHTFEEQMAVLRNTGVAVGMHGSALIMAAFLPPGALLVELFPFAVPPEKYTPYKTMAGLPGLGLEYLAWSNKHEDGGASVAHPDRDAAHGGLGHLPVAEQQAVVATKSVPPHLCCTDPHWLFRIYQDTRVDVPELLGLVAAKTSPATWGAAADTAGGVGAGFTPLSPGPVRGAACHVRAAAAGQVAALVVSFSRPWNLVWLQPVAVAYEVHVDELKEAWETPDTELAIAHAGLSDHATFTVWVRAVVRDPTVTARFGPYGAFVQCTHV